jgi:quercetin dioxygenase-like cupin family protein
MGEPTVILPGRGEIIGDSPDRRVVVLSDADELHATWSRFAAGRDGAGPHIHHLHIDLFYVLDGVLTVRLGPEDEQVAVAAGTLARVPPLVVHGFRNSGDAEVRYLNLHAPGCGFIGYMRGLRDGTGEDFDQDEPPADGGRPRSQATVGGETVVIDESDRRVELLAELDPLIVSRVELAAGEAFSGGPVSHDRLESLFVLDGELELRAGDGPVNAPAGTWVQFPAGLPHSVSAAADGARYLALRS